MTVVVASDAGAAHRVAVLVAEGRVPAIHVSPNAAAEWVHAHYPLSLIGRYGIYEFEHEADGPVLKRRFRVHPGVDAPIPVA